MANKYEKQGWQVLIQATKIKHKNKWHNKEQTCRCLKANSLILGYSPPVSKKLLVNLQQISLSYTNLKRMCTIYP